MASPPSALRSKTAPAAPNGRKHRTTDRCDRDALKALATAVSCLHVVVVDGGLSRLLLRTRIGRSREYGPAMVDGNPCPLGRHCQRNGSRPLAAKCRND